MSLLLILVALGQEPPQQPPSADRRWEKMDYGPFLSAAITMPWPKDAVTPKGIVIKVGTGAVCFDSDLLRYAAGWTDGWLELLGPPFEGTRTPDLKTRPLIRGSLRFATRNMPGFIKTEEFRDPRPEPYGPLPADLAKYRGLYVAGERVCLSYTVGKCEVLDTPGFEKGLITRTLRFGPTGDTVTMLLADMPEPRESKGFLCGLEMGDLAIGCVRMPEKAEWKVYEKTRVYLRIPGHDKAEALVKIVYGPDRSAVEASIKEDSIEDPVLLTKGGPARFPNPVVTRGVLGRGGGAYEVDTLTAPDENPWNSWLRFGGLDFFSDGRAAVCTWSGDVWIVSGIDSALEKLSWKRYATGLFQPCGLKIVNDTIYVVGRDQITVFRDLAGHGEADFYENFNNDCTEKGNYHEFAMDLHTDPEGNFYYAKGGLGANFPGGAVAADHGCFLKVSKDGKRLEIVATGIRAAAGSGVGPRGEMTTSDQDGHWGPASRINWIRKGGYYGDPYTAHQTPAPREFEPPLCWIHRSLDNSSGGEVWVTSDAWGPFKGRMLHLSYGTCSLFQVLYEKIGENQMQGGVVRFPLTFASGILRARFSPGDGQLYVAGLRGWSTSGTRDGCLQRVRYTGKPVCSVIGMHVKKDAIELGFTEPLDPEVAGDTDRWAAQQWNYLYSEKYGSPDFSVEDPKKQGRDPVDIKSVKVSTDGKKVTLEIPGLKPVMQMLIRYKLRAVDGAPVQQEIWHTIHKVP